MNLSGRAGLESGSERIPGFRSVFESLLDNLIGPDYCITVGIVRAFHIPQWRL